MEDRYIMQYVRKNVNGLKRQKVGLVVAVKVEDQVRYGWSLAKVRGKGEHDSFDMDVAMRKCFGRISANKQEAIPVTVQSIINHGFEVRAKKYFRVG